MSATINREFFRSTNFYIFLLALALAIIWDQMDSYKFRKLTKYLSSKYPLVEYKEELKLLIDSTYFPPHWRGGGFTNFVTFKGGLKRMIDIHINDKNSENNIYFGNILTHGDSILKETNSNEIILIHKNTDYTFMINTKKE